MLSLLSGILYPLLFPKFNLTILFVSAFVPIIFFSLKEKNLKKIFFWGWLSGTLSSAIMFYWIYLTLIWNQTGFIGSVLGYILLSVYIGGYWGIFALSISLMKDESDLSQFLIIPSVWVLLEFLRTVLFTGFGWLLSGYLFYKIPSVLHIVSFTGVYGLSFLFMMFNVSVYLIIRKKKYRFFLITCLIFIGLFIYGKSIPSNSSILSGRPDKIRVSLLQPNISQYKKWSKDYKTEILSVYEKLALKTKKNDPELIVWPETALPDALTSDHRMYDFVYDIVEKTGTNNLIGSAEIFRGGYYNSAYLISPDKSIADPYRKLHLVPFGEYIPFRNILSSFIGVVNELGDFNKGKKYVILETEKLKIGTGICFEDVFPQIARTFIKNGAEVFVNITNDAWYLKTAGAYQHFIHSIMRAAENRVFVIRAANTGISAIIDPLWQGS